MFDRKRLWQAKGRAAYSNLVCVCVYFLVGSVLRMLSTLRNILWAEKCLLHWQTSLSIDSPGENRVALTRILIRLLEHTHVRSWAASASTEKERKAGSLVFPRFPLALLCLLSTLMSEHNNVSCFNRRQQEPVTLCSLNGWDGQEAWTSERSSVEPSLITDCFTCRLGVSGHQGVLF